ncbi:MAG: transposase, partial [Actinobacteria bacterium]|nr:transposase [Actinomycetota bacterium]
MPPSIPCTATEPITPTDYSSYNSFCSLTRRQTRGQNRYFRSLPEVWDYASIFADMHARRVLFATEGRCADTVARFAADLAEHGGDPTKITDTSSDMSAAFISGIGEHLPNTGDDLRQVPCGRQAQRSGQR